MTIDYDRLRQLVAEMEQGTAATTRYTWLDLSRELLRLRDGVKQLRDEMTDLHHAGRVYRSKETNAVVPARAIARHLTGLLNGDTE